MLRRSGVLHRLAARSREGMSKSDLPIKRTAGHRAAASVAQSWAATRRPAYAAILKPRSAALPHADGTGPRAKRALTSPDDRRIPRRWADRKTPRGRTVTLTRGHGLRFRLAVSSPRLPRAPRPSSQEADGLQLASSWTRDGASLSEAARAGISFVGWVESGETHHQPPKQHGFPFAQPILRASLPSRRSRSPHLGWIARLEAVPVRMRWKLPP